VVSCCRIRNSPPTVPYKNSRSEKGTTSRTSDCVPNVSSKVLIFSEEAAVLFDDDLMSFGLVALFVAGLHPDRRETHFEPRSDV